MAISLKHEFHSDIPDNGDPSIVGSDEWNDEHVLTMDTAFILGRLTAGPGVVEEIGAVALTAFLGLVIGEDTQAHSANLDDWSEVNPSEYTNTIDLTTLLANKQPLDSDLTAIAALATVAYGRGLLTLANATALAAEVDSFFLTPTEGNAAYQPLDADLTAIAALANTDSNFIVGNGSTWVAESGDTARASMGVGAVLLASGTLSGATTASFVLTSFPNYHSYKLYADVLPATDGITLQMRFSTNGGSSYDSGAGNYSHALMGVGDDSATPFGDINASATLIELFDGIGNATTEGAHLEATFTNLNSAARNSRVKYELAVRDDTATSITLAVFGVGTREAAQDTDAFQLIASSGNLTVFYTLVGIRPTT